MSQYENQLINMNINKNQALALKERSFQKQVFQIFALGDPCNP